MILLLQILTLFLGQKKKKQLYSLQQMFCFNARAVSLFLVSDIMVQETLIQKLLRLQENKVKWGQVGWSQMFKQNWITEDTDLLDLVKSLYLIHYSCSPLPKQHWVSDLGLRLPASVCGGPPLMPPKSPFILFSWMTSQFRFQRIVRVFSCLG